MVDLAGQKLKLMIAQPLQSSWLWPWLI